MDYKRIPVKEETHQKLNKKRPEGVTWDYWLRQEFDLPAREREVADA